MKNLKLFLSYFLITVLFAGNVFAGIMQPGGPATLSGQVTDNSGSVPGATVRVKDASIGTVTDLDGNFVLQNVPAGKTVIVISFIGYENYEQEMDVQPGANEIGNVTLNLSSAQLAEVVVRGEMAPSQMKAYNMKLNSLAVSDILASDAIGKLPDRNAAEAVQRISGVAVARYHGEADRATVRGTPFSWTSTLFNGTRLPSSDVSTGRSTVLDVVPSEILEYAKVTKALTPDMEGDAIGGSIDFVTRTAPAKRTLAISAASGYNMLAEKGTYNFSGVYGDRFLDKKLGVVVAASTWKRNWGVDQYTVTFNTGAGAPQDGGPDLRNAINNVMLKRYMGSRTTNGLNAGVEYAFTPAHKIYARGLYDTFVDERPVYESYFLYNTNQYQYNYRESKYNTLLYGGEIGGKHELGSRLTLDWSASDYYASYKINSLPSNLDPAYRGLPIITFFQNNVTFGGDGWYTNPADGRRYKFYNIDSPDGKGDSPDALQAHNSIALNDADLYLSRLVITRILNMEHDIVAQVNLDFRASDNLSIKVGGKFRNKDKELEYYSRTLMANGTTPTLASMERGNFPNGGNFFNKAEIDYKPYVMDSPSSAAMRNVAADAVAGNGFTDRTTKGDSTRIYSGYENAMAAYIMAVWDVTPKVKLYGGLRNEYTKAALDGRSFDRDKNTLTPSKMNNSYNILLPMVHLKYQPGTFTNVRAAYTTSFVRPVFDAIIPSQTIDITGPVKTISRGNKDIKPTLAYNFDLMFEHFFGNIGLVSAGVFTKVIRDLIYNCRYYEDIDIEQFYVSESRNLNDNSWVAGFEVGGNRRFDMLPGFLKGFGLEANYTFIYSEAKVPVYMSSSSDPIIVKTQLPQQSKSLVNVILYYEMKGLTVKLAGNYRGKSVEDYSNTLPSEFWRWTDSHLCIDMSASYAFNKNLRIFAEVQNLTNEPVREFMGDSKRTKDIEWSSVRGQAGIRWNIF